MQPVSRSKRGKEAKEKKEGLLMADKVFGLWIDSN
jgi:hypothetical protein